METGFSSFTEYLTQSNLITFPSLIVPQKCSVVDIRRREGSGVETAIHDFSTEPKARSAATKILETLLHPPQNVCLRVVLWWLSEGREAEDSHPNLLDVCGLALKVSPRFFEAIVDRADKTSLDGQAQRKMVQPSLPTSPFQPMYTVVGTQLSTVARNYLVHQADPPPVLLIVGWDDDDWDDEMIRPADVDDGTSTRMFVTYAATNGDMPVPPRPFSSRTRTYHRVLDQLLGQIDGAETADKYLLTLSTFPMIHLDTLHIQAKTRSLRKVIMYGKGIYTCTESSEVNLHHERFLLRRHIEDSECSRKNVVRFAKSQDAGDLLTSREYLRIEELWQDAIREARLLETEIRDILQLQTSQFSLQESKKSIDLSNHQIEESRRGT